MNRAPWKMGALVVALATGAPALAAAPKGGAGGGGERTEGGKPAGKKDFPRLRAILRAEPSIREVQNATIRFYKLEPERINRMATAARMKGLIPEFEAGLDNSLGHVFTNTKDGLYPVLPNVNGDNPFSFKERVDQTNDQLLWRVRAVWNLDRLVFNAEELDVKSLASIEETLVREVTTMFYSRRRLVAKLVLDPPDDEEEKYYQYIRLDELTATLDALTGGKFASRAWQHDMGD